MKFPFYSNYTIDDSNIGCHRIIYADCDGVHKYKSVCELMKECTLDPQLKKECIVDFLNSNLSTRAGQYLKIDNKGCLTTGTPECPCDDKKVGATKNDNSPGPLIDKLIGGCDATGTYCISVGTPNPNVVQVLPSGPINGFTQFKGGASCDNAYVKMDKEGNVFTECPELQKNVRYAYCKHTGGEVTIPWNETHRIPVPADGTSSHKHNFTGRRDIMATEGFARDSEDGVILIQEPGLYTFSFSCYVGWRPAHVYAIRAGLRVDGHEIGDFKYNGPAYDDINNPRDGMEWYRPNKPKDSFGPMSIGMVGLSFNGAYTYPIVNASVSNPARIKLFVKPDTRVNEERMINKGTPVTFTLAGGQFEFGPPAVITIHKVRDESLFDTMKTI